MISLRKIEPLRERVTKRLHICKSLQHQIVAQKIPAGSPFPTTHAPGPALLGFPTPRSRRRWTIWFARLAGATSGKGTFTADRGNGKKRPLSSSLVAVLPVQEDIAAYGATTEMLQLLHGNAAGAAECGARVEILSLSPAPEPREIESALHSLMAHDGGDFSSGCSMRL